NPLLEPERHGFRQRLLLSGARHAHRVLFFTRGGLETAVTLGLNRDRLAFVPLGVRARREAPSPPGRYLLAAGREERDWDTLAAAAYGLDAEVRVLGPPSLPPGSPLHLLPPVHREEFLALLEGAAALVVPLRRTDRTAGQLAVLDAMSVGRGVVATRAQGTEDYVRPSTGRLVPARDAAALRAALREVLVPGVASALGAAALAAAQGPFSLERFVAAADAEARGL
ncbi:MAG TPA: glycosyltransferase, partial [Thermoanaerobaculaceae bacterium]|nr:glycosyltransferase [Thermoanaerobaculaceae bacterium]